MKYLTILFVLLSFTITAQSLSEITGETRSLYNAICIYNDITPGDIGMKEFRKLAAEYAEEVGCTSDYELYLYNGGNNLFILHYNPAKKEEYKQPEPFWGEDESVDYTNCNCGNHNAVDRAAIVDSLLNVIDVDTIVLKVIDTITKVETRVNNIVKNKEYCDCEDLDLEEAFNQYKMLQRKYKEDKSNNNAGINSMCQVKLKKYMRDLKRETHRNDTNIRLERLYNDRDLAKTVSNSMSKPRKKKKRRRTRRLGKGHAKTANNGFWQKLFPFANC